jgi:hypothetical protein
MVHDKKLPLYLWGDAVGCALCTLNRVISTASLTTPFSACQKRKKYSFKPFLSASLLLFPLETLEWVKLI